ncbi:MAG TPA: serine hydrolase domain-containing protein [Longimicrobiales bacterium]|nr:serine hydrolase domain-containing protein [Longimicrobiales bacterium]
MAYPVFRPSAPFIFRIPVVIVATLLAACAPAAQAPVRGPVPALPQLVSASPEAVGLAPGLGITLDSIMRAALGEGAAPGAALVVSRHGRLVHAAAYGRTDLPADAAPVTDSTLFDLASLTKVVATTTAAMILEEEGRLDLDRPVREYVPGFDAPDKAGITVRMLLTHSSGLVAGGPVWRDARDREGYLHRFNERELVYAPGDSTIYSDWGLILTAWVVEAITGQGLDAFLEERVWRPLGMRDTGFNPVAASPIPAGSDCTTALPASAPALARIAATEQDTVYRHRPIHGVVHDENACALGGVAGHAGLFSSARDLAVFGQMLLNGGEYAGVRILQPTTVARWTARQGKGFSRALGWDTPAPRSSAGTLFSPRSFGHTGFTGTSIWLDPERGLAVILLTNRVNPTRANTRHEPLRRAIADAVQAAVTDAPVRRWR